MNRKERLEKIRAAMSRAGFETVIVAARGVIGLYGSLEYLTGHHQRTRVAYAVLHKGKEPILVMPSRSDQYWAQVTSGLVDVRLASQNTGFEDVRYSRMTGDELVDILRRLGITSGKVGVAGLNHAMAVEDYVKLTRSLPAVEFVDATAVFDRVKRIKDQEDLAELRATAAIADAGFQTFLETVAVGKTEWEVTAAVEQTIRSRGAAESLIIVTPGPLSRWPSDRRFAREDVISLLVEVTGPSGFWVERGGMMTFGQPDARVLHAYEMGRRTMEESAGMLRPGKSAAEVAAHIEQLAVVNGCQTGNWHGHGVGIDHDGPAISKEDPSILEMGMALAMHPSFISSDGHRAHMAEVYAVTANGGERLSRIPQDFHVLSDR